MSKPLVYSLVARGHETVLSSFSKHSGNFPSISLNILYKCNLSKMFHQFATQNFYFYAYVDSGIVFLVMVQADYKTRLAFSFLKTIKEQFQKKYSKEQINTALPHSLKDFNLILHKQMTRYEDPANVDSLSKLEKELTELEELSLKNMNKVIQRGQKVTALLEKSEMMNRMSTDMNQKSKQVHRHMWWKNKKVMIAIGVVVLLLIVVIVLVSVG